MTDVPATSPAALPTTTRQLPALHALGIREELQGIIESCAKDFLALAPRMHVRRATFGGAWVVGVHGGGRHDGGDLAFSRLDFEFRVDAPSNRVDMTRRSTIRNRDDDRAEFDAPLDDDGRRRIAGFVESAFLEFARRYFER